MQTKASSVFNAMMFLPIMLGICSAIFMAYVFWWPPTPAYVVYKPETHTVKSENGYMLIHRAYCINQRIPITITRDIIRVGAPGDTELRYTLPSTVQVYEMGCHDIERIFQVPETIPPGNYRLSFQATWEANPFREGSVQLPDLMFVVKPK